MRPSSFPLVVRPAFLFSLPLLRHCPPILPVMFSPLLLRSSFSLLCSVPSISALAPSVKPRASRDDRPCGVARVSYPGSGSGGAWFGGFCHRSSALSVSRFRFAPFSVFFPFLLSFQAPRTSSSARASDMTSIARARARMLLLIFRCMVFFL